MICIVRVQVDYYAKQIISSIEKKKKKKKERKEERKRELETPCIRLDFIGEKLFSMRLLPSTVRIQWSIEY